MEVVVLVIHLILALALIGVVLLQRSEGAALLSGGGSMTGRPAVSPLGKVTWALAIAFITTSIALTIIAAANSEGASVVDRLGAPAPAETDTTDLPSGADLLPPTGGDAPLTPPRAD
ncbi:MAG: preprotein translocase subunit SecG [Rhodobacteraceae bacterium]|jgi:preprotein translocase subunit SecG|nr:preprotein translocase subunit SecG [Paracoccaceae bacterium]